MKTYTIIATIFITFLLFGCREKSIKSNRNTIIQQDNNKIAKETEAFLKEENCPCIMPREDGRYGSVSYKASLVDNQKELVIKLCENGNNNYALSLESWAGFDSKGKLKRGKIYDYKAFKTDKKHLEINGCTLENEMKGRENWEQLNFVYSNSSGVISKWRIKKGKLIELDKNKDFPCMDYEKLPYE